VKALTAAPSSKDNWTGFYVGVGGGKSSLNNKLSAQPGSDPSLGLYASLNGLGADGLLATINAGFDYQFTPSFVVGIFGDYDFHSLKSTLDVDITNVPLNAHGEISVNQQWSIGGRFGYLTSPSTLVFVSGGYTALSLSNFVATVSGPFPAETFVAAVPRIAGGFVGTGFETKLTTNVSLRGEYRFSKFGSGQVTLPTIDGTDLNSFVSARISPTLQIVKASVNYRF
jgi:outer membrane immunogenic protein